MRHKKAAVCCVFLLMAAALFADNWVLAAEAFSGDEAVGKLIPSLILDALPTSLVRTVTKQEQVLRKINELEKEQPSFSSTLENLTRSRDSVLFSKDNESTKKKKIAEYEQKIVDERLRMQENLSLCEKLSSVDVSVHDDGETEVIGGIEFCRLEENVVLWKNSSDSLYVRHSDTEPTDIQALITGSVQIRKGFLYVKAGLVIYPGTIVCNEVVAAGDISDAETIAQELASGFIDTIVNATPVSFVFSIQPAAAEKNAKVTVDGMPVQNPEIVHNYQSGIHTVCIEAPGYEKQLFTRDFSDASRYQIDVHLPVSHSVNLQLTVLTPAGIPSENSQIWVAGKYAGFSPVNVTVNGSQALGVIRNADGVPTYFALDATGRNMTANVLQREETAQSRIEKARKSLYTSYGLLLLSLPFTFYAYGRMNDAYTAYTEGIPLQNIADDFRVWQIFQRISLCVSIGCGGNMIYRIIKYMQAADSVLPEEDTLPEKEEK